MDSDQTAKALLNRGGLRSRVTIIPLNKARTARTRLLRRGPGAALQRGLAAARHSTSPVAPSRPQCSNMQC